METYEIRRKVHIFTFSIKTRTACFPSWNRQHSHLIDDRYLVAARPVYGRVVLCFRHNVPETRPVQRVGGDRAGTSDDDFLAREFKNRFEIRRHISHRRWQAQRRGIYHWRGAVLKKNSYFFSFRRYTTKRDATACHTARLQVHAHAGFERVVSGIKFRAAYGVDWKRTRRRRWKYRIFQYVGEATSGTSRRKHGRGTTSFRTRAQWRFPIRTWFENYDLLAFGCRSTRKNV